MEPFVIEGGVSHLIVAGLHCMEGDHIGPPPPGLFGSLLAPEQLRQVADELRAEIGLIADPLVLVGLLASDHGPSRTYADYTEKGCREVGVRFDLRTIHRLEAEAAISSANADPGVHGVILYYPIFGTEQDRYLRTWSEGT
jgi:methylenetetrahydrofolate dehydrogenase (NADP+)/methenyltetrahydrofolate cyclohydrolase